MHPNKVTVLEMSGLVKTFGATPAAHAVLTLSTPGQPDQVGFGRSVALYYRSYISYQTR